VAGAAIAGSIVIMVLEVSAPAGTRSVAVPFNPVTVPPPAPMMAPSLTVTCTDALLVSDVAVIVTVPVDTAVTRPSADTLARL
jgi:hypothetical protein